MAPEGVRYLMALFFFAAKRQQQRCDQPESGGSYG
jgi:hypothetical protein